MIFDAISESIFKFRVLLCVCCVVFLLFSFVTFVYLFGTSPFGTSLFVLVGGGTFPFARYLSCCGSRSLASFFFTFGILWRSGDTARALLRALGILWRSGDTAHALLRALVSRFSLWVLLACTWFVLVCLLFLRVAVITQNKPFHKSSNTQSGRVT